MADAAVRRAEGDVQTASAIANPNASVSDGPILNYSDRETPAGTCVGCSKQNLSWGVGDNGAIVDPIAGKRWLRVNVARAAVAAARMTRADAAAQPRDSLVKQQYSSRRSSQPRCWIHSRDSEDPREDPHLVPPSVPAPNRRRGPRADRGAKARRRPSRSSRRRRASELPRSASPSSWGHETWRRTSKSTVSP